MSSRQFFSELWALGQPWVRRKPSEKPECLGMVWTRLNCGLNRRLDGVSIQYYPSQSSPIRCSGNQSLTTRSVSRMEIEGSPNSRCRTEVCRAVGKKWKGPKEIYSGLIPGLAFFVFFKLTAPPWAPCKSWVITLTKNIQTPGSDKYLRFVREIQVTGLRDSCSQPRKTNAEKQVSGIDKTNNYSPPPPPVCYLNEMFSFQFLWTFYFSPLHFLKVSFTWSVLYCFSLSVSLRNWIILLHNGNISILSESSVSHAF